MPTVQPEPFKSAPLRRSQSHDPQPHKPHKKHGLCDAWLTDTLTPPPIYAPTPERALSPIAAPSRPQARRDDIQQTLAGLMFAEAKHAEGKCFEDLRRAINSVQPTGGWGALWVYGPLARWLAQGAQGPAPVTWHVAVILQDGDDGAPSASALKDAQKKVLARLGKRGFEARPHDDASSDAWRVQDTSLAQAAVLLTFGTWQAPGLQPVAACEQLVYDMGTKSFTAPPGIQLDDAWHSMGQGYWRATNSTAQWPSTGPQACAQLLTSWRHQAAGYSPTDAPDWQDSYATLVALEHLCPPGWADDLQTAATSLVPAVQRWLAPELSLPQSPLRRLQQATVAVALTQVSLTLAVAVASGSEHPLRLALQRVLRGLVPQDDAPAQEAVALTLALADDPAHTALLRLFVRHLPQTDAPWTVRKLNGLHGPMLRLGAAALQTHLYLPDVQGHDLSYALAHVERAAPLGIALQQGETLGARVAATLGCPSLAALIDAPADLQNNTRPLWADALLQLAANSAGTKQKSTKARLLVAAAMLHPQTFSRLHGNLEAAPPFEIAADVAQALAPCAESSETVRALTLSWQTLPHGHKPWQDLQPAMATKLIERVVLHGAAAAALHLLDARPELCTVLSPQTSLTLCCTAVDNDHASVAPLLESMVADTKKRTLLHAQSTVLGRACALPQLASLCGRLLSTRKIRDGDALTAWLEATTKRCATAPLTQFLAHAPPGHQGYRAVTEALTELLQLEPKLLGAHEAGRAWRRLIQHKKAAGESELVDVMRLADLHLHLTKHDQPGILQDTAEDRELMLELSFRRLSQAQDDDEVAQAVQSLRATSELLDDVGGHFILRLVQLLPAPTLVAAWGDGWVDYVVAMLEQPTAHAESLPDESAKTLMALTRIAAADAHVSLAAKCALIAHTATIFVRAKRPELTYVMLTDFASDLRYKHQLLQQLGHMPMDAALTDAWNSAFVCAAYHAPAVQSPHEPGSAQSTANSFWALLIGHIAVETLAEMPTEMEAFDEYKTHITRALNLIGARAVCCAPHVDEHLLQALTQATAHPLTCKAAVLYLMEHSPRRADFEGKGHAGASPVATAIWRAVMRSIPAAERRGFVLYKLFFYATGVRLNNTLDLLQVSLRQEEFLVAIEWAEFFLDDVAADAAAYDQLLHFFLIPRANEAQLPYRLDLLQRAVSKTRGGAPDAVYTMAVEALLEAMARRSQMSDQEMQHHDIHAFDLAYALFLMDQTIQTAAQARLLEQVIERVRVDRLGDTQLWADFVSLIAPLLQSLPDRGEAALATFHRHNQADVSEARPGVCISQNALGFELDHFTLFTARIETAGGFHAGAIYDELLMAHALFVGRMHHRMLGIYLPTVARLCGEELFNKHLCSAMLQRHLRLGVKEVSNPGFNNWLFEGLLQGAPMTVAHLAVAMTLDQTLEAPEHRAERTNRLRRLLTLSDSAMVREAAALSKKFGDIRTHLLAHPEDADGRIAEAQAHLDGAWGPWWPPQLPKGMQTQLRCLSAATAGASAPQAL